MKAHFEMMAAYNAWANRRLYAAAGALPEADYRADLGAFFGSIHGTLNHLVVSDRLWLARFRGEAPPHARLDEIPHDDRAELRDARRALDDDIVSFAAGLTEDQIASAFTYRLLTAPGETTLVMGPALTHFFNHQTHHRGQVHALLTRLTGEAPPLDIVYFLREG